MNKMKKSLLGTVLAGAVVVGASAGTYAWFNADYTVGGSITNHTLELNDNYTGGETLDFGNEMLAPSRTVSDEFQIKNTGSLDQIVRAKFDLALYDGATNVGTPDKSQYTITATAWYNGNKIVGPVTGNVEAVDAWLQGLWLPNDNGIGTFKPNDTFKVKFDVKLLETAGNEYQDKTLKGGLKIEARQTDAGSQF